MSLRVGSLDELRNTKRSPTKPRATPERDEQKVFTDWCDHMGICWMHIPTRNHAKGGYHTANEGTPGFPDLCLAYAGASFLMEWKAGYNKATPDQQVWLDASGGVLVRTFEHAKEETERRLLNRNNK